VHTVTLAVFVAFSGFTIVMPFLPLYVRELGVRDPGAAAMWSGLIFGVSPLLAGLLAPVWGAVADRYGRKPMLVRALVAFVIVMFLTAFVRNVQQLFLLRSLAGLFGGFGAMAMAMITTSAPEDRASAALGRLQAVMLLSNASGPFLGGLLASALGIRRTFLVSAALCAVALLAVALLFKESARAKAAARSRTRTPVRQLARLPFLLSLVGVLFLSQFVNRGLSPILPLYVEALGAPARSVALWAGAITSASAVASAFSAALAGRLAHTLPHRTLLLGTLVGGLLAAGALAAVQSVPQILGASVLMGLLAGGTVTLVYSVGSRRLPEESRGASFGLLSTGSMVGGGLSPFISGAIAAVHLRLVFALGVVVYAAACLVALRLPSKEEAETEEGQTLSPSRPASRAS
jgi:MFS family permease